MHSVTGNEIVDGIAIVFIVLGCGVGWLMRNFEVKALRGEVNGLRGEENRLKDIANRLANGLKDAEKLRHRLWLEEQDAQLRHSFGDTQIAKGD
jgi:hypothetical protein